MVTTTPTSNHAALLQRGHADCQKAFSSQFGSYRWILGNLSAEKHRDCYVILGFLGKSLELLSEKPFGHAPATAWENVRDELRQASLGQSQDPLSVAVAEVIERHSIAKQWLFDVLDGVDLWVRFGKFETYEELAHFACKIGGSTLNALIPVLEFEQRDYEVAGAGMGQAMAMTQILLNVAPDQQKQRCFLPLGLLRNHDLSLADIHNEEQRTRFSRLVRYLAAQIELEFYEAAPLLNYLSFDGQRVLKSLLAWHWELLNRIKQDPLSLLEHRVALNRREVAKLRLKHLLGTEGAGVPIVSAAHPHNHNAHSPQQ